MRVTAAKRWLGGTWLLGFSVLFLVFLLQTLGGRFRNDEVDLLKEAWAWFLAGVMPTSMLIVGVFITDLTKRATRKEVPRFYFALALGLSLFYFVLFGVTFAAPELSSLSVKDTIRLSQLWLAPVQGLTALALSAFFRQ